MARAIQSVVYGQVVILVQDGKVVQIDRTEKVRLR
ncbi:MAG: YezD family protein [Bacillota bacterium]